MTVQEETDKLAVYRQQVAEKNESQTKMSETAKAKLRALNEHERQVAVADSRLVKEFNSREWPVERLVDLFASPPFGGAEPVTPPSCSKSGTSTHEGHESLSH